MRIPISYKNLSLKEFIQVKTIELSCPELSAKRSALITYFTGQAVKDIPIYKLQLYKLKIDLLLESWDKLVKAKLKPTVWIKGKRYKAITDATKLNVNQCTIIKSLVKDGQGDKNLNKLAAAIFYRYPFNSNPEFNDKLYEEISEAMLSAKVGDIAPTVFFYAKVLDKLTPILEYYLVRSQLEIEKAVNDLIAETPGVDLEKTTDGTM